MIGVIASLIDGMLVGAVYGLAAMGLTLIWGVMNVINLTHGANRARHVRFVFLDVGARPAALRRGARHHGRRFRGRRDGLLDRRPPRDRADASH